MDANDSAVGAHHPERVEARCTPPLAQLCQSAAFATGCHGRDTIGNDTATRCQAAVALEQVVATDRIQYQVDPTSIGGGFDSSAEAVAVNRFDTLFAQPTVLLRRCCTKYTRCTAEPRQLCCRDAHAASGAVDEDCLTFL